MLKQANQASRPAERLRQWYSSSQNHFSFSFYKVWAQSV